MRRIGILFGGFSDSDPEPRARVEAFRRHLQELGWTDGRNIQIDLRIGAGDANRVRANATGLMDLMPDVLAANSTPALVALKKETSAIPIVFVNVVEPVAAGFVASLAHPGGNITGFTNFEDSMGGKWLELLKEIAPGTTRIALILDPAQPATASGFRRAIESAAPSFGVQLTSTFAGDAVEIERFITEFDGRTGGGLVVPGGTSASANRELLIELTARYRLPAIYAFGYFPRMGGLISYGVDGIDLWRRAATYVDRILRGAQPRDLPIQQPTKFELVINLKTAKALGLEIPPTLLARADEVIE
jgi:ABC-type uncharacterized transport system substrate-binding protein